MDESKKNKLIIELLKEKNFMNKRGKSTKDHELAIEYLKTGEIKGGLNEYEILSSCVEDFDCIYNDYCS
jgi:hypothetical protein